MNPTILSRLELADHKLTYCLSRKLKTKVGRNVQWNLAQARTQLRSALTMLKKVNLEETSTGREKVIKILQRCIEQV